MSEERQLPWDVIERIAREHLIPQKCPYTGRYQYYTLVGQTPVPASMFEWAAWFEQGDNRRVMLTRIGPFEVSTVFIGLDHGFGPGGPPILFETMSFMAIEPQESDSLEQVAQARDTAGMNDMDGRDATWLEAEARHARAVAWLKSNYCVAGEEPVNMEQD